VISQTQEFAGCEPKCLVLKVARREVGEAAKWKEDRSRPSEKARWQRSRDLANSGVRREKAQALGVQSHEDARGEKI
jgi:hypothetical protein